MNFSTLGDLCLTSALGPFGSNLTASDYTSSGVPLLRGQNVTGDGHLDLTDSAFVSESKADEFPTARVTSGDIVTPHRGAIGRMAIIPSDTNAIVSSSMIRATIDTNKADPRYVVYYFSSPEGRAEILMYASTVGTPGIGTPLTSFRKFRLPLPPLPEQQAIAEVLGALDDKIAANRKLVTTSLCLAQALHDQVITAGDVTAALYTDVVEVGGGATPKTRVPEYWDGDIHWASPTDITALGAPYLHDTSRHITQAGLDSCSSPLYPEGSILMTSRATIGAFAVAQEPTAVNQGFIVLIPKREELRWWLLHDMMGRVKEFQNRANGATFLELSKRTFKTMEFDLPSDTQLLRFDESARALHEHAIALGQESRTLAQLRDTLLPALMDGTIRVKDAEKLTEEAV